MWRGIFFLHSSKVENLVELFKVVSFPRKLQKLGTDTWRTRIPTCMCSTLEEEKRFSVADLRWKFKGLKLKLRVYHHLQPLTSPPQKNSWRGSRGSMGSTPPAPIAGSAPGAFVVAAAPPRDLVLLLQSVAEPGIYSWVCQIYKKNQSTLSTLIVATERISTT